MPPDHMIPKHDFSQRPDPEREMEVEFTVKLVVFGRMKQVTQTRDEIERYMKLHISPDAKVVASRMQDKPKPLPGVAVPASPRVSGNGTHPDDLPF